MGVDGDPVALSRSRAEDLYQRDAACRGLGIALLEVAPGQAKVAMTMTDSMVNGHGMVHGGYVFLLADAAFSYACNTYGPVTVAQGAQVTFLRPAHPGDTLIAAASERARYGRNGIYDVTVSQEDGTIVAEFRGQSVMLAGKINPSGQ
jgi:acyl-CoA thioesterase